eukprot:2468705-Amphidinium_carterae.1
MVFTSSSAVIYAHVPLAVSCHWLESGARKQKVCIMIIGERAERPPPSRAIANFMQEHLVYHVFSDGADHLAQDVQHCHLATPSLGPMTSITSIGAVNLPLHLVESDCGCFHMVLSGCRQSHSNFFYKLDYLIFGIKEHHTPEQKAAKFELERREATL